MGEVAAPAAKAADAPVKAPSSSGGPAPAAPAPSAAGSLGDRQLRAQVTPDAPSVGGLDDPAEKAADAAADRVMRTAEKDPRDAPPAADAARNPVIAPPTPPTASDDTVRRRPVSAPGTPRPDVVTPGGVAPLVTVPGAGPPTPAGMQPARSAPEVPSDLQAYLDASRGTGEPLPEGIRAEFESSFNRSLARVGIHDTHQADSAARRIDALAFTRGSDIYFRSGAFDPQSPDGKRLLAHELTHVVQNEPGINRQIRRAKGKAGAGGATNPTKKPKGTQTVFEIPKNLPKPAASAGTSSAAPPEGRLNGKTLTLAKLYLPKFKLGLLKKGESLAWNQKERTGQHVQKWTAAASEKIAPALRAGPAKGKSPPLSFQFGESSKAQFFLGTVDMIASALSRVPYDKGDPPTAHSYDIDHKLEHQLGGDDEATNLWLLDRSDNRAAGPAIGNSIRRDVEQFLKLAGPSLAAIPDIGELTVTFSHAEVGPNPRQKTASGIWVKSTVEHWKLDELSEPKAVAGLKPVKGKAKERAFGSTERLAIYTKVGGGRVQNPKWDSTKSANNVTVPWAPGFKVTEATYSAQGTDHKPGETVGHVAVSFYDKPAGKKKKSILKPLSADFPITAVAGVEYGGLLNTEELRRAKFEAKAMSLIDFSELEFELDSGLRGRGRIPKPSLKVLENVDFAVDVSGDDVGIVATISGGALKLPGPFSVLGGQIALTLSTDGITAEGDIGFEIAGLATGRLGAAASTKLGGEFALEGELNFDSNTFKQASVQVGYRDGTWSGKGTLEVLQGKIKGIASARVSVGIEEDRITAEGSFITSIKGVKQGKIGMRYDPATGTEISGEIEFGDLPGVKSGKLAAVVRQGAEGWTLAGDVTMVPSIPGAEGSITGRYEDGGFLVNGTLAYSRGIASGSISLGLTNASLDAGGKPTGPPKPGGPLTAFGEGTVTLKLTEWLQGTVGIKLKPNGEIEVMGEVALPSELEVFKEKKVDRTILDIGIDVPILGVAVAGQRIGIFATVRGGVTIGAGFGPGVLKGVSATVTYNPDHPEATTVAGQGTFYVPASAGLRLNISGALGAGIPVVSATAGLTVFGEVGLAGFASASAALQWSASKGVTLDASGTVEVQPKFRFGIEAFVDVSADLWVTTIELYHQKWSLASFEYGPALAFGMTFPIHYESGKPFELTFDQVQWKYPQINPSELLGGLVKQLVG